MSTVFLDELDVEDQRIGKDDPVLCAVESYDTGTSLLAEIEHLRTWDGPGFLAVLMRPSGDRVEGKIVLGVNSLARLAAMQGADEIAKSIEAEMAEDGLLL